MINNGNYENRGGNSAIVLCCPTIVAPERLVYFDHNLTNWVIRDFIGRLKLDSHHSLLTIAEIEADAIYDESPPWCNVQNYPDKWRTYLTLRSTAVFKLRGESVLKPHNPAWNWRPIGSAGPVLSAAAAGVV